MGRTKGNRKLNFKPIFKSFIPENKPFNSEMKLLAEEMEAIYLMDVLNLYQEDAAKKMEVSRPTFTRILKNARNKIATALVSGSRLIIEDDLKDYTIAFCSNDENFKTLLPLDKYIFIYKLIEGGLKFIEKIENPAFGGQDKVAKIIPDILLENNVNIFIASKIGEGLKNSLVSKGIDSVIKNRIDIENFKL